jgi:hypothetical protein
VAIQTIETKQLRSEMQHQMLQECRKVGQVEVPANPIGEKDSKIKYY